MQFHLHVTEDTPIFAATRHEFTRGRTSLRCRMIRPRKGNLSQPALNQGHGLAPDGPTTFCLSLYNR